MLFHSFEFIFLLIIAFALFYLFPKKRLWMLAISNLVFYSVSGVGYLLIFLSVALITYYCSRKLSSVNGRIYYFIAIIVNLCNLVFFKYTGFILRNIEMTLNIHFTWQDALLAKIILPIGISFYTFQLIAYIVDVWRKDIKPCKSFVEFWVFIAFFAQLIAGPIMRGQEFLPQVAKLKEIKYDETNMRYGLYYIGMGMTKKLIFADMLAPKVQYYFSQVSQLGTLDSWFAAYLFAFQIYFDFSSYSEIAVGIGHLFGLRMAINFKTPYLSGNASEFWKRWHITLSSWIKDYIYIPLGGSRRGFPMQCIFLLTAMALSGLWHGAAWGFIVWGIYHGLLSVAHKVYSRIIKDSNIAFVKSKVYRWLTVFVFFQLTTIGWVFFRAQNLQDAIYMVWKMISFSDVRFSNVYILYFGFIILLWILHFSEFAIRKDAYKFLNTWRSYCPEYIRAAAYVMIFIILVMFTQREQSSFIYFQF